MKRLFIFVISILISISTGGCNPKNKEFNSIFNDSIVPNNTIEKNGGESATTLDTTIISKLRTEQDAIIKDEEQKSHWILYSLIFLEGLAVAIFYRVIQKQNIRIRNSESKLIRIRTDIEILKGKHDAILDSIKKQKQVSTFPINETENNGKKENRQNQNTQETNTSNKGNSEQSDCIFEYLYHHKAGILKETSKENAFYLVSYYPGETIGHFEFLGDAVRAIKNKDSAIDGVCETRGSSLNANAIKTEKWGECVKDENGDWKVTKPAIISFQ